MKTIIHQMKVKELQKSLARCCHKVHNDILKTSNKVMRKLGEVTRKVDEVTVREGEEGNIDSIIGYIVLIIIIISS